MESNATHAVALLASPCTALHMMHDTEGFRRHGDAPTVFAVVHGAFIASPEFVLKLVSGTMQLSKLFVSPLQEGAAVAARARVRGPRYHAGHQHAAPPAGGLRAVLPVHHPRCESCTCSCPHAGRLRRLRAACCTSRSTQYVRATKFVKWGSCQLPLRLQALTAARSEVLRPSVFPVDVPALAESRC